MHIYPLDAMVQKELKNVLKLSLKDIENIGEPIDDDFWDLTENDFKKLDPESKQIFIRDEIRHMIKKYGLSGLSVDELVELTNHDQKTIKNHLDSLIGLREVYSQKKNKKLVLYYPNGKPLHGVSKKILDMGNTYFEISLAIGPKEKQFFHVLEKRVSLLDVDKAEGAILIPLEKLNEFKEKLDELYADMEVIMNA